MSRHYLKARVNEETQEIIVEDDRIGLRVVMPGDIGKALEAMRDRVDGLIEQHGADPIQFLKEWAEFKVFAQLFDTGMEGASQAVAVEAAKFVLRQKDAPEEVVQAAREIIKQVEEEDTFYGPQSEATVH
jgi:diphthamide synthase (EF-2-diphthine--ammonia ligase)